MRIIIIEFDNGFIDVFEDDDQTGVGFGVCFINSPSIELSATIRSRIIELKSVCEKVPSIGDISLNICKAVARDELEEAYVNGLSGKVKPRG